MKRPEFLWLNIAHVQRYKKVVVQTETERIKRPDFWCKLNIAQVQR
jgi:hypothetical protein